MTTVSALPRPVATVRLRRSIPGDAAVVHAWRAEPATRAHQPIQDRPLDEVRAMLRESAEVAIDPTAAGKLQWIILADDEPAGWISLDVFTREHASGAVGYTVAPRLHGRGVGGRAIQALLPIAFDPGQLDLARLEGVAAVDNVASRRILERAGFRQEGLLRGLLAIHGQRVDHALYGLLRTDWIAAHHRGTPSL